MNEEREALRLAEIRSKIEQYCAYRERCSDEVKTKLESLGVDEDISYGLIEHLKSENFLDDERFAKAFARGKLRQNKWGKVKISMYLKQKGISHQLIGEALSALDEEEYSEILEDILQKKLLALNEPNPYVKKHKAAQYATGKGFEQELIWSILKEKTD